MVPERIVFKPEVRANLIEKLEVAGTINHSRYDSLGEVATVFLAFRQPV
jgi:hypothetical protein